MHLEADQVKLERVDATQLISEDQARWDLAHRERRVEGHIRADLRAFWLRAAYIIAHGAGCRDACSSAGVGDDVEVVEEPNGIRGTWSHSTQARLSFSWTALLLPLQIRVDI